MRLHLEKNPSQKMAGEVAQGEFKPQNHKNTLRKKEYKSC
jgi:hypothetical protein